MTKTPVRIKPNHGGRRYYSHVELEALQPLRVTRQQTAKLLSCSVNKVKELERAGKLTPIKDEYGEGTPNSVVYHNLRQVQALAGEEGE